VIPFEEYLDEVAQVAIGWLGWTEEQLFFSDLNTIEVGYRGRRQMWQSVFGTSKTTTVGTHKGHPIPALPDAPAPPVSASKFDAMFS
jgi:hypothetical protein